MVDPSVWAPALTGLPETGGSIRSLGMGLAGDNAHSVAVDPQTHHVFLAVPSLDGPWLQEVPAMRWVTRRRTAYARC